MSDINGKMVSKKRGYLNRRWRFQAWRMSDLVEKTVEFAGQSLESAKYAARVAGYHTTRPTRLIERRLREMDRRHAEEGWIPRGINPPILGFYAEMNRG